MTQAQQPQTVPVHVYRSDHRIMVAAPMPGLEPQDITVAIDGDKVRIHGAQRGPDQMGHEVLVAEWMAGPYHRELQLPEPVDGARTNATYGNGVLVLVMPRLGPGEQGAPAEFGLEALAPTRGQRVGHHGHAMEPTTTEEHRQRADEVTRQAGGQGGPRA